MLPLCYAALRTTKTLRDCQNFLSSNSDTIGSLKNPTRSIEQHRDSNSVPQVRIKVRLVLDGQAFRVWAAATRVEWQVWNNFSWPGPGWNVRDRLKADKTWFLFGNPWSWEVFTSNDFRKRKRNYDSMWLLCDCTYLIWSVPAFNYAT